MKIVYLWPVTKNYVSSISRSLFASLEVKLFGFLAFSFTPDFKRSFDSYSHFVFYSFLSLNFLKTQFANFSDTELNERNMESSFVSGYFAHIFPRHGIAKDIDFIYEVISGNNLMNGEKNNTM